MNDINLTDSLVKEWLAQPDAQISFWPVFNSVMIIGAVIAVILAIFAIRAHRALTPEEKQERKNDANREGLFAEILGDTILIAIIAAIIGLILGGILRVFSMDSTDTDKKIAFEVERALAAEGYQDVAIATFHLNDLRKDRVGFSRPVINPDGEKRTLFVTVNDGELVVEVLPADAKDGK